MLLTVAIIARFFILRHVITYVFFLQLFPTIFSSKWNRTAKSWWPQLWYKKKYCSWLDIYTWKKWNNVAIVCDGTRILGLGNIGPEGALPVMEGKSVLFKALGGINAFPLCISTQDKDQIINFVKAIEPVFGAINIEDIESSKVLEIVERLQNDLSIPVFHDD